MATTVPSTVGANARTRWRPEQLRDALLAALALATGAVDALSWLLLGKVFSAFMTGNLVFLGLMAGGAVGPDPGQVVVAIVAFALGAALGARVVRSGRNRDRWWPFQVTVCLATTALLEAGVLGVWKSCAGHPSGQAITLVLGMLAMAMGIQTVAIASLGVRGVFTTAATATLAILMGDVAGWSRPKGERLRLVTVVGALVIGAGIGGLLVERAPLWAPLFPVCITMLVVTCAAFVFNE
jgi:uncharacterized membrane protein YoaK (UPF0700 family)